MKILAFEPKVEKENVITKLKGREKRLGRLFSYELVYLGYYFFIFNFIARKDQKEPAKAIIAADTVDGSPVFFKQDVEELDKAKEIEVEDKSVLKVRCKEEEAYEKASDELRKRLLKVTMWRKVGLNFSLLEKRLIYFPYYVGYYLAYKKDSIIKSLGNVIISAKIPKVERENKEIRFEVVNALSGELGNVYGRAAVMRGIIMDGIDSQWDKDEFDFKFFKEK
ncbi:MAG: hypothetical protein QXX95_04445 [Nitrososphaerales archaeon]